MVGSVFPVQGKVERGVMGSGLKKRLYIVSGVEVEELIGKPVPR